MRANDACRAVAALAASQHGAFSRRQAADLGVDAKDLHRLKRAGLVAEPRFGALVLPGAPDTWRRRLMVVTLCGTGRAVAAGRSAAALHRLDGVPEGKLEFVVPLATTLRAPDIVVHRVRQLEPADRWTIDGIACTGLARTLADLGDHVGPALVHQALDDALRRGVSTRWLRETAARLVRPGCPGPSLLLRLLDAAEREQRVPDSWFERLLEAALASPDLPPMVRQHTIRRLDGTVVARVDLALPSVKLGIEAHSRRFHFGREARQADEDRDLRVAAEGWQLLYLGWQDALHPAEALRMIRRVVAQRPAA